MCAQTLFGKGWHENPACMGGHTVPDAAKTSFASFATITKRANQPSADHGSFEIETKNSTGDGINGI